MNSLNQFRQLIDTNGLQLTIADWYQINNSDIIKSYTFLTVDETLIELHEFIHIKWTKIC